MSGVVFMTGRQNLCRVTLPNAPSDLHWVTRQFLLPSRNQSPVQHWPAGGLHANATFQAADAVIIVTAKIGIEIKGFIFCLLQMREARRPCIALPSV